MLRLLNVTRSSLLRYSVSLVAVAAALLFIYPNLAKNLFTTGTDFEMFMSHGYCYFWGVNSFITKTVSFTALVEVMKTLTKCWFEIVELPPASNKECA